jgi:hypothetical protein
MSMINFLQRLDLWRDAFSSAYLAVRHGKSCGLYVIYPEVRHVLSVFQTNVAPFFLFTTCEMRMVWDMSNFVLNKLVHGEARALN